MPICFGADGRTLLAFFAPNGSALETGNSSGLGQWVVRFDQSITIVLIGDKAMAVEWKVD